MGAIAQRRYGPTATQRVHLYIYWSTSVRGKDTRGQVRGNEIHRFTIRSVYVIPLLDFSRKDKPVHHILWLFGLDLMGFPHALLKRRTF